MLMYDETQRYGEELEKSKDEMCVVSKEFPLASIVASKGPWWGN